MLRICHCTEKFHLLSFSVIDLFAAYQYAVQEEETQYIGVCRGDPPAAKSEGGKEDGREKEKDT